MTDIIKILNDAGYKTIEDYDAIQQAIKDNADHSIKQRLCSGYRVFPDGSKCTGCKDCEGK